MSEAGTAWVRQLLHAGGAQAIYTVRISGAEIVAALFLRARTGSLTIENARLAAHQFKADFQNTYQIVEVTPALVEQAMDVAEAHGLRGYDSVQLAGALSLHDVRRTLSLSPLTFVCADGRLNRVASAIGLAVENPNDYS